jgi:hypothetical protein
MFKVPHHKMPFSDMAHTNDELLKLRFELNMARSATLVELAQAKTAEAQKPPFDREGAPAETLRAVIVFLHATFEVALRSYQPNDGKRLTFSGISDLDKALRRIGTDPVPFKSLYPPLGQMAKRRHRIVHHADLPTPTATLPEAWSITDEWQLMMWLIAVPAFYYKMRIALGVASDDDRKRFDRHEAAMGAHVEFGYKIINFSKLPADQHMRALQEIDDSAFRTAKILRGEIE